MIRFLVEHDQDVKSRIIAETLVTGAELITAIKNNNFELVKLLSDLGANMKIRESCGDDDVSRFKDKIYDIDGELIHHHYYTPLEVAADSGNVEILKYILQHEPEVVFYVR